MKFYPLIIEPQYLKLGYLYQAMRASDSFKKGESFRNINDTIYFLHRSEAVDLVLISACFTSEEVKHFRSRALETPGGKEAAFVMMMPVDDEARENVAHSVIDGLDGVLFSPYSVESVREVAKIAADVRAKFEKGRMSAAMRILLPNLTNSLDDLAICLKDKSNDSVARKNLSKALDSISSLRSSMPAEYLSALESVLRNAKPRSEEGPGYAGASKRIRARFGK